MVEETQPPEEAQQTGEEVAKQEVTKEEVTQEETVVAGGEDARERLGPGLLWIAALALIAVPVLIGFIFLRGGDESTGGIGDDASSAEAADAGMGGGMGDTASAAGGVPVGVGNIEDILASDIVIEPDATGSGVVVRLTTSIEVACAVSYGIDTDLGSIATDSDMAGGGHLDHHPVLRGLNPGVTYAYRLSAIGPDGRLYQSGLREFTFTPGETATAGVTPAPDVAPPAPNVAGMATVADVSSEYSDAFAAAMAIDGDLSTEWSSDGDGDDAFIVLDFGEEMIVQGVGLRTREMSDGTSITTSFTVTANGTTYGPFQAGPGLAVGLADFVGQSIRFDVDTSTGGNTGAIEVEVYGETDM
jgi:hypothetical protein